MFCKTMGFRDEYDKVMRAHVPEGIEAILKIENKLKEFDGDWEGHSEYCFNAWFELLQNGTIVLINHYADKNLAGLWDTISEAKQLRKLFEIKADKEIFEKFRLLFLKIIEEGKTHLLNENDNK